MSTSYRSSETEPLLLSRGHHLPTNDQGDSPNVKLLKFLPVVVLGSVVHGISMFSRYEYQKGPLSDSRSTRFDIWLQMPGFILKMDMWATAASIVVSFISIGWWSALGDRRGRKYVLFFSVLGALLREIIYVTVKKSEFEEAGLSVALIVDGLLGGFVAFNGVAHAYISEVSVSSLSRTSNFCVLQAVMFISFRLGAFLGLVAEPYTNAGFVGSTFLACYNLAYIYSLLPEPSLELGACAPISEETEKSAVQYIASPATLFLRRHSWRKRLVFLVISVYTYSLTFAFGVKMEVFTSRQGYFPAIPRALLSIIPSILSLLTWLCIIPALTVFFKRTHDNSNSTESGRFFATRVAQYSILLAAACTFGFLVFGALWYSVLYAICFFLYPFSVAALPALYSLAASYFLTCGRGNELGVVFGSLSMWVSVGEYISYYVLGDGLWAFKYEVSWAAIFLVVSLLLLAPEGPLAELGGVVERDAIRAL
ncbi:putative membrane protein C14C4.07 [Mycena venus]|uniref:Putative membrane protein C14C4.07 n=1 Tax=Mycena venus TaxID=2733690 RepID=A0A8H6XR04_9AGAR|nr:putative membrane protein C14C4.07 [Mycena venus]